MIREFLMPTPMVLAVLVAIVLWHVLKTEQMVKEMSERPPGDERPDEGDGPPQARLGAEPGPRGD